MFRSEICIEPYRSLCIRKASRNEPFEIKFACLLDESLYHDSCELRGRFEKSKPSTACDVFSSIYAASKYKALPAVPGRNNYY